MAERTLSSRELNRALLARQLLLERADLPLTDALEQLAGLQTQYAPSGYIGLWSRLRDFRREALTQALESRQAVQATLMRRTIHMVSAPDYWWFAAAVRGASRDAWRRGQRRALEGIDMERVAERVRVHLTPAPRRQVDMLALLAAEGYSRIAWVSAGQWVDLVRVPPSGTWHQRRADLFGLADTWLPAAYPGEAEALRHATRRYLGAFGPATLVDVANWAGVPITPLRAAVKDLELIRYRDEQGRELLDLPDAAIPAPDTPAPVRFLPTWDATLLVHARRTAILPEAFRPLVFNTKTPHSVPTFTVDGAVAGTWGYRRGRVEFEPFAPLTPDARTEVEEEADRLARFHV